MVIILIFLWTVGRGGNERYAILRIPRIIWMPRTLAITYMLAFKESLNDEFFKKLEDSYKVRYNAYGKLITIAKKRGADVLLKMVERYRDSRVQDFEFFKMLPVEDKLYFFQILKFHLDLYSQYKPEVRTELKMSTLPLNENRSPINGFRFIGYEFPINTGVLLNDLFFDAKGGKYGFRLNRVGKSIYYVEATEMENVEKYMPIKMAINDFIKNHVMKVTGCQDVDVVIMRHYEGLPMQMESLMRSDLSIFIANFNCDVYYDMAPILTGCDSVYRIRVNANEIIELRDAARFEWAHGVPDGIPNISKRIAIIFRALTQRLVKKTKKNEEWVEGHYFTLDIPRFEWMPRELALAYEFAAREPLTKEYFKDLLNHYDIGPNATAALEKAAGNHGAGFFDEYVKKYNNEKLRDFGYFKKLTLAEKLQVFDVLKYYIGIYSKYTPVIRTHFNMPIVPAGSESPISGLKFVNYSFPNGTGEMLAELFRDADKKNYGFWLDQLAVGVDHLVVHDPHAIKFNKPIRGTYVQQREHLAVLCRIEKYKNFYRAIMDFIDKNLISIKGYANVSISIVRQRNNMGLRMHQDGIINADLPIISANFGCDIYYDMVPVLTVGDTAYRILIKKNEIISMEGVARYEWAHGIPDGIPGINERFAIIFKVLSAEATYWDTKDPTEGHINFESPQN